MKLKKQIDKIQEKIDVNCRDRQYLKHEKRIYRVFCGSHYFTILDMTNAGKKRKFCTELKFYNYDDGESRNYHYELLINHDSALFEAVTSEEFPSHLLQPEIKNHKQLYFMKIRGIEILPFDLSIIKPLKNEPKKWTKPYVIRALVNGQFKDLRRVYRYTDSDYWDRATDFGAGPIDDSLELAEEIITINIGWSFYQASDKKVKIYPHSKELYEFIPII